MDSFLKYLLPNNHNNNEYANKINASKQNHNNELLDYARYIEENKEEISNLVANFLINR